MQSSLNTFLNIPLSIYPSTAVGSNYLIKKELFSTRLRSLKLGVWVYFFLLIFEGALRKWLIPGLATPLLIVRDPIAIWLIYTSWRIGILKANLYLTAMLIIVIVGFFTAIFLGHKNLAVAIFGTRIFLVHFPLLFIIGKVFTAADVIKMGKILLWLSIPMTILVALQFYSPQSAWVNRGVGGDIEGGGFSGALGYFRPPGTFSFTTGMVQFYALVACFIVYFIFKPRLVNRLLLMLSIAAVLFAVPLSISRTLLFQLALTIVFSLLILSKKPAYLFKMLFALMGVFLLFFVVSKLSFFSTAFEVFTNRFENATESEGGLKEVFLDRFLGGMLGALTGNNALPFFGYGSGMGTNVGSKLLTGGNDFLIAEGEWGRVVGEFGPLLGLMIILIRLSFCIQLTAACFRKLLLNDFLPWLLLSFGLIIILQGQWAQPATLGFAVLVGGLILSALNDNSTNGRTPV